MVATESEVVEQHVELVRFLARSLVGPGVDVDVRGKVSRDQIRIDLRVPEAVRGRVIGRGGRIARSLRNILSAAAIGTHKNVVLDIVD